MPRNMSFALTTRQFKDRSKTVTRRCGWDFLEQGDLLWGVKKAMGLKKGESIQRLGLIDIVSAEPEPLEAITADDVEKEGFPGWSTGRFIDFFCKHNGVDPETVVNRIEFQHIGYLATELMLGPRILPNCDAKIGELVFLSTELCAAWECTRPFYVSANTLKNWVELEDICDCKNNYIMALNYYQRAYKLIKEPQPAWKN